MNREITRICKASPLAITLLHGVLAFGQVSVLTQHNDNARTGQNLNETTLNTSNVNQNSFGKLFWRTVDGFIYAQPLYVPGLTIQGATHNVVYVATQHNSVYAFDADNPNDPAPLWQVNLGTPVPSQDICIITGDTNPGDCPYYDISPEIGITSTPVIDPVAGIIYVVNRTKNTSNSTYHDYLHALNLDNRSRRARWPSGDHGPGERNRHGSSGGIVTFRSNLSSSAPRVAACEWSPLSWLRFGRRHRGLPWMGDELQRLHAAARGDIQRHSGRRRWRNLVCRTGAGCGASGNVYS